jgi:hypothetical protein
MQYENHSAAWGVCKNSNSQGPLRPFGWGAVADGDLPYEVCAVGGGQRACRRQRQEADRHYPSSASGAGTSLWRPRRYRSVSSASFFWFFLILRA